MPPPFAPPDPREKYSDSHPAAFRVEAFVLARDGEVIFDDGSEI